MPGKRKGKADCGVRLHTKDCGCGQHCLYIQGDTCRRCGKPQRWWCQRKVPLGERCDKPGHDVAPLHKDVPTDPAAMVAETFQTPEAKELFIAAYRENDPVESARRHAAWLQAKAAQTMDPEVAVQTHRTAVQALKTWVDARTIEAERKALEGPGDAGGDVILEYVRTTPEQARAERLAAEQAAAAAGGAEAPAPPGRRAEGLG